MAARIPRNLIHIWGYRDDKLTDRAAGNKSDIMTKLSPEWSLLSLGPPDIETLVQRYLPQSFGEAVLVVLRSSQHKWIQKADVARVIAVFCLGGIYCDICDITVERPLDALLRAGLLLCKSAWTDSQIEANIFAAPPW